MRNLNVLLMISSIVANAKSVGDGEIGFDLKRFDLGLETCMESFDVHVDKIIRTQDSRAMGAKYLNEAEVGGREECMKFCCETLLCDVFVFEQKIPGSCYLFHCGSPEDFKCKFTQHKNYTSAVLAFNNRLGELENRMKLTNHEKELTMLRNLNLSVDSTTTPPPSSTKVPAVFAQPIKQNHTLKSQCSRYQFECRESGECIAIYNACDGIPQCPDGSDEGPELDCPTISGASHPKTFRDQLKSLKGTTENFSQVGKVSEGSSSPEPAANQIKQSNSKSETTQGIQTPSSSGYFPFGYSQKNEPASGSNRPKLDPPHQTANRLGYYGREGEMVQYPVSGAQWPGYQVQRQEENGYVYSHKGSGLVPENSEGQFPVPYGNEMNHADYLKYASGAVNNGYYTGSGPAYYPVPNAGWIQRIPQPPHGMEDVPQRPLLSMYGGNGVSGSVPSDYYYEDSQMRGRFPQVPQDLRRMYNSDLFRPNQKNTPSKDLEDSGTVRKSKIEENEVKKTESVKKALEGVTPGSIKTSERVETTTQVPSTPSRGENPRKETSRIAENLKMSDGDGKEVDGVNERPSGAILSLTLGMCITGIMITLVGCRLRVVRKRMRRNGKSPYAHDSDFLVNGMYL